MLALTRKVGQAVAIGDDVVVTVAEIGRGRVRLAITAPRRTPILRFEVLERLVEENRRAASARAVGGNLEAVAITFPRALPGLADHQSYLLADVDGSASIRALVSTRDPAVQLLVVDAVDVAPGYPVELAERSARAALPELDGDELAVALVVTLPVHENVAYVNLLAPIVVGVRSRHGAQVILEGSELPVRLALGADRLAVSEVSP